jgi:hemoglobin-like flavoprotein
VTPEQVAAVQTSTARVGPHLDAVADDFYRRLFGSRPDVRTMFPDDLAAQRRKFADELNAIVTAIPDFGRFRARASELGARHAGYGVRGSHYAPVRENLLAALAAVDPGWDEAVEAAWRSAYDLVAELMQSASVPR